jgi:hypothetical protein
VPSPLTIVIAFGRRAVIVEAWSGLVPAPQEANERDCRSCSPVLGASALSPPLAHSPKPVGPVPHRSCPPSRPPSAARAWFCVRGATLHRRR